MDRVSHKSGLGQLRETLRRSSFTHTPPNETEVKDVVRTLYNNVQTIADIYSRFARVFTSHVLISGASISLIFPERGFDDIDFIIDNRQLILDRNLSERLAANGFDTVKVRDEKLLSIRDIKAGVKIDVENNNLTDGKGRLLTQEEVCQKLGCEQMTNTTFGFPKPLIIEQTMTLVVQADTQSVEIRIPSPPYQVFLKYNLWRIRQSDKDIRDIKMIIDFNFGSYADFLRCSSREIEENRSRLGQDFKSVLFALLK